MVGEGRWKSCLVGTTKKKRGLWMMRSGFESWSC